MSRRADPPVLATRELAVIGDFRSGETAVATDLSRWTVARRIAISGWRKKTSQDRAHERHGAHETTGPPTEDRVAVVAALRLLPEPVREAVTLHYIGDLSIDQIAHETNTPAGTIKARLHRGRAQLAQALRHEENPHG